MRYSPRLIFSLLLLILPLRAGAPPLKPWDVPILFQELRDQHARGDESLTPALVQRIVSNYIDLIDPAKLYLLNSEVDPWLHASTERLEEIGRSYQNWQFGAFETLDQLMAKAIARRAAWKPSEIKELPEEKDEESWATTEAELALRWQRAHLRFRQVCEQLPASERKQAEPRMLKRRAQWESQWTQMDSEENLKKRLVRLMKASASSLDDHTSYFTPQEAKALQVDIEQKLVGIGIQLRDELDQGFSVMHLLENGPAEKSEQVKEGDRITAVNGKNVMGWEIDEVVEQIRGPRGTPVELTLLRNTGETVQVKLVREEIAIEGRQCEVHAHPFGRGIIGHIRLHSFYTDYKGRSSSQEIEDALKELSKDQELLGVILDLRQNGGGLLGEALEVSSLFMPRGATVLVQEPGGYTSSVKGSSYRSAYLGPLLVLTSRASASGAEIVAQTLQEQGRAIVVGDDHTFGKGSYQIMSTQLIGKAKIDPKGEFKVTRGFYYTASGHTPQLVGVPADLVVPSPLAQAEVGERFNRYPLDPNPAQLPAKPITRAPIEYLDQLKANSAARQKNHTTYKTLIERVAEEEDRDMAQYVLDYQLEEAFSIMKDLLVFLNDSKSKKGAE